MSGEKHTESSGLVTPGSLPDASSVKNMDENSVQTNSAFPASEPKVNEQSLSLEQQGVYYVPTNNLDGCYHPGQSGSFGQAVDIGNYSAAGGSYMSDNTSLPYYHAGYGPLSENPQQQPPCTYESDAFACYSYDSTLFGNGSASYSGPLKSAATGSGGSGKSNGSFTNLSNKTPFLPCNERVRQAPNFDNPMYQSAPLNHLNKSTNRVKGYPSGPKFSSFTHRNLSGFMQYGPRNYQSNSRTWNNYSNKHKTSENFGRNAEIEALTELTRGPRSESRNSSLETEKEAEQPLSTVHRDAYNLQDFRIEYNDAKFFVIKSYSEDDVHKSIKYNVWSSTPNGNKKLDAAFREVDAKANEAGEECPVFLFFSVNGSGQFVGVAEMIGRVDFTKNMDFWQLDKWNGFFPVRWHIIKDVPNSQLKHITLENNENKAITHSRDTQEIWLTQGLAMLSKFKNYSETRSVLDDMSFYEKREKILKSRRNNKLIPQANGFESSDYELAQKKYREASEGTTDSSSTLVSLTKNLSLDS